MSAAPLSTEQLRAQLEAAANESPADPQRHLELALFDARTGRLRQATAELSACAVRFPLFARAHAQLGVLRLQNGDFPGALSSLERAAKLESDDADTLFFAALAAYRAGHPDEAKRFATASLKQDPNLAYPYLLLSYLNDRHGTATLALANLRDYIARSPQPAPAYFLMGRIYAKLNDRSNAELWLKRALDADPQNPNPSFLVALGRLYTEQFGTERMTDGIRCFEQALAIAPDNPEAHRYLGHALLQQQRYGEAVSHLQASGRDSMPHGPALYDLGQALMKMGRAEEGKRLLAVYRREADFARDYEKLAAAVNSRPSDPARHLALVRYCLDNGQYEMAKRAAARGLDAAGANAALQQALEEAGAHAAVSQHPVVRRSSGDIFSLMEGGNGGD